MVLDAAGSSGVRLLSSLEELDRATSHLLDRLPHGSESWPEQIGPVEVVEGDKAEVGGTRQTSLRELSREVAPGGGR